VNSAGMQDIFLFSYYYSGKHASPGGTE
jgi:hypothetical protein